MVVVTWARRFERSDKLKFETFCYGLTVRKAQAGTENSSHIFRWGGKNSEKEVRKMKQEEKKPPVWEITDPKPPVVQSGKMENRKQN